MSRKTLAVSALVLLFGPVASTLLQARPIEMEIRVEKPVFVLPQFAGPYMEREASIAPEEYEMAEQLNSLLDAEDKQAAITELEKFYDLELSPAMLTLKAQVFFSLEMYDKAEKTYLSVLKRKPQLVRAHADLAQLYMLQKREAEAREHFAKAISLGANEAILHGQLAYLNLRLYGAYSAISEYQQAMSLEPANTQWQQGLLAALTQARMYEPAQALVRELIEKRPTDKELWLNKAAIALQLDNREQALAALEVAMLLGEASATNVKTAAQLHLQLGSYDRAFQLLSQHVRMADLDMTVLAEYIAWLSELEMWQQANSILDSVEERLETLGTKEQSLYYTHRAMISAHQQRAEESQRFFDRALEKDPANGDALLKYARLLAEQGKYVKSELIYMRAEAVDATAKSAMLGRAQLYIDMKDHAAALNQLRTISQRYPQAVGVKDNMEILESIIRTEKSRAAL